MPARFNKHIFGEKMVFKGNYTSVNNKHAKAQKLNQKLYFDKKNHS